MQQNYKAQTVAGRFTGLGAIAVDQFATNGSNFSQSVVVSSANGTDRFALGSQGPDGVISLTVKTASGVTVNFLLTSDNDGLSVSIEASGALSDSERAAIGKLADGFQKAIDGLSANPPKLDLSGLTQFDTSVLSSVKFEYSGSEGGANAISASYTQSATLRSLSMTNSAGALNIKVDTSNPALWGTDAQRAQSIASLLQQFSNAASRGHGDQSLLKMFDDGFSEMNQDYGTPSPQTLAGPASTRWQRQSDQAMLSGLGDFTASMKDTPTSPNSSKPGEVDSFDYNVSQDTKFDGSSMNGTVTQNQHSQLLASYHQAASGEGAADLMSAMMSQSYDYIQINDQADSTVKLVTSKGVLAGATLTQSSDNQTRDSKYEHGVLVSDVTTPDEKTSSKDLLSLLEPLVKSKDASSNSAEWQQELTQIHGMVQLNADES